MTKPINVQGVEIPQAAIDAALARMNEGPFRAKEIEDAIADRMPEHPPEIHSRATDRLIQRERTAGHIVLRGKPRRWHRVEASA